MRSKEEILAWMKGAISASNNDGDMQGTLDDLKSWMELKDKAKKGASA
jgi:hypothetical protein